MSTPPPARSCSSCRAFDPTRIANDAQLTQTNTGLVDRTTNEASVAEYGDVPLQRNVNTLDPAELAAAGEFLTGRFGVAMQRIQSITLPVSTFTSGGAASGAAWTACLPLDVGARVRVMRRPPGAPTIQIDGFVESVKWTFDDKGGATLVLQISNAAGLDYWQLSSTHAPLHAATTVGATTAVFGPLPDSATNPIQSNVTDGNLNNRGLYNWVIDWGLSTCEYVTLTPTKNAAGYTTWTATIGATMRFDTGGTSTGFQFPTESARSSRTSAGGSTRSTPRTPT